MRLIERWKIEAELLQEHLEKEKQKEKEQKQKGSKTKKHKGMYV